jgi:hypothetical protein
MRIQCGGAWRISFLRDPLVPRGAGYCSGEQDLFLNKKATQIKAPHRADYPPNPIEDFGTGKQKWENAFLLDLRTSLINAGTFSPGGVCSVAYPAGDIVHLSDTVSREVRWNHFRDLSRPDHRGSARQTHAEH